MNGTADKLAQICSIAHDYSRRAGGRSLRDLLASAQYSKLRPAITKAMIAQHLASHPGVVEQWKTYSSDKRTRGGWYLTGSADSWEVGRCDGGGTSLYGSGEEACSEFILKELDFWTDLS